MTDPVAEIVHANYEAAKRGILSIWTVYDRPKDYPTGFIARRFACTALGPCPTLDAWAGELEQLREGLNQAGLVRMQRHPDDDAKIVETWL